MRTYRRRLLLSQEPISSSSSSIVFQVVQPLDWTLRHRTPLSRSYRLKELVDLIERMIKSENCRSPNRPIYLVGESLGACLALNVAARNPHIDLILILANPATCFSKS